MKNKTYFNSNNTDARFKSYIAKRVSQDQLVFSISDQNFGHKNPK